MTSKKFWKNKKPEEYTPEEWESVCMHCGRCCQIKLQDEDSGEIYETNVVCRYHNCQNHLCTQYSKRHELVPSCLILNPQNIGNLEWIPDTCAYYILARTGTLPAWHHLVSGKPLPDEFKIPADVVSELLVPEDEMEDHIIEDEDDE